MILIGYSGHAYVVVGILASQNIKPTHYCDDTEKANNPFSLHYLGKETEEKSIELLCKTPFFIAIGDNNIRRKIQKNLSSYAAFPQNVMHKTAIIDTSASISPMGVFIAAAVIVNPLVQIGQGAICNTACVIEHNCIVGDFAHIGPGAILCGNVTVGDNSFIGAGSVIKQGIKIGRDAIVGAGSVVVKDVADNMTVMGCPAK